MVYICMLLLFILFAYNNRYIERCFRCFTRSISAATVAAFRAMISDTAQIMSFWHFLTNRRKKRIKLYTAFYVECAMLSFKHFSIGINFVAYLLIFMIFESRLACATVLYASDFKRKTFRRLEFVLQFNCVV